MLMSGRIIPTVFGNGWKFPGFGPPPTPWSFNSAMKLSWHLWVRHFTCWFRIKSSLSAILVPLGIGLCCVLGPCHSFGSCALPLFLLLHNECSGLISFKIGWFELVAVQGILKSLLQHHSSKASILHPSTLFMAQLSHPYMTTGKAIVLTLQTFVGKVMSLLFNSVFLSIG